MWKKSGNHFVKVLDRSLEREILIVNLTTERFDKRFGDAEKIEDA